MELLKDFIWPLTAIIAVLIFYKPITKLIDSITKIKTQKGEVEFEKPSAQRRPDIKSMDEKLADDFDAVAIQSIEKMIEEDLDLINVDSEEEKLKRLKKYAAVKELINRCESLYSIIYGSQLKLLQHLNSKRGSGETKEDLKKFFYDPAATANSDFYKSISFEKYFDFLWNWLLITKIPDDKYGITVFGKDFLTYLMRQGVTFDLPY